MGFLIQAWLIVAACGVLLVGLLALCAMLFDDSFEEYAMKAMGFVLVWLMCGAAVIALAFLTGIMEFPALGTGGEA